MFFSSLVIASSLFPLLSLAIPSLYHSPFSARSRHRQSVSPPRPRLMTYYADWAPPRTVNYSLTDAIIFAFTFPDENCALAWDSTNAPQMLAALVPVAHGNATKVMLSIGGWTGSKYFSNAVSTPQNRQTFANNILATYRQYNLDGIDIDWEYPYQAGDGGNTESPSDSANLLEFLRLLRRQLPRDAMISAAVQDSTFAGPDGRPLKDVSAFAEPLTWITLMNYDTYELRQPPGPNAPLYDGCKNSSQPTQNAVGGYNAWTAAGFPPSQIMLGVPAYGYVIDSSASRLSTRSDSRAVPDDPSGQIQFNSLLTQEILVKTVDGSFQGNGEFTREWDSCSATPYLRSESAGQVIPYDDPESLAMKAVWVRDMGMAGVNLFDIHGDTPQHDLMQVLRANLSPSTPVPATTSDAVHGSSTVAPPHIISPSPSSSLPWSSSLGSSATHLLGSVSSAIPRTS